MTEQRDRPRALLVHKGELADVRALLAELDVDVFERAGRVRPEEAARGWDLLVCTGPLAPDLHDVGGDGRTPPCIAIVSDSTRTLSAHLRRAGVDLVVRRPFHPTALRLLVVRALYQGPERRQQPRVAVGAPVRIERGLRRHPALLVDLSLDGCRIESRLDLARGDRVSVVLPRGVSSGRRLALRAEVVRSLPGAPDAVRQTTLRFRSLSSRGAARLAATLERHASGPPRLDAEPVAVPVLPSGAERRRMPRHPFDRRVIALGDEAARVLVGRDLSLGGMRVEPNASLRVGESLRLAIHGRDRAPAIVEAEVVRDEGDSGYVLRFSRVGRNEQRYLEALLDDLPTLSDPRPDGGDLVVSERLA